VTLLTIVTVVLLYAPYWDGGSALSVFGRNTATSQTINSLGDLAIKGTPYLLYMAGVGPHPDRIQTEQEQDTFDTQRGAVTAAVKWVSRVIAVMVWVAALAAVWRWPTLERWLETSFWMLLIILLFAAIWFWPWYATWPLALAALLDWHPAGALAVAFTGTGLASYTGLGGRVPELIMLPPVIALLIYLLVPLRRRALRHKGVRATWDSLRNRREAPGEGRALS
ncbi:MAG TPA: hypothetical protein VER55_10100, partial [Ardenticatenaceae bacterium]|nr:hypothetical protein [Ardenticatenaceae bacterium]